MKKIYYENGPDFIEVGTVGRMLRGKPVEVTDELAAKLLAKTSVTFKEFTGSSASEAAPSSPPSPAEGRGGKKKEG